MITRSGELSPSMLRRLLSATVRQRPSLGIARGGALVVDAPVAVRADAGIARSTPVAATTAFVVLATCIAVVLTWTSPVSHASVRPTVQRSRAVVPRAAASVCHVTRARSEPSREAPRSVVLRGYTESYCADFSGARLPQGWDTFSGVPKGDRTGRFARSHVRVRGGLLTLVASRDPAYHGAWATGGVCQCGRPRTYGAFFVRSRVTGAGPDEIDLLWPVANVWPPEIDFNESVWHSTSTTWTVHFGAKNHVVHGGVQVNLTRWHTWGVIWTPHFVRFLVDGRPWGATTSASAIPHQPMTLDISQQTFCGLSKECPKHTVSMQVDWVVELSHR